MTVPNPIRIDHMQRTLRDVYVAALSELPATRFVWVKQGIPRPPRPYVGLHIIDGPDARGITTEETRFREAIDSTLVTIDTAVDGQRYRIRVNGLSCDFTAPVSSTLTIVRDGLRDAVQAMIDLGQGEPLTLADVGADAFDVLPVTLGDLIGVTTTEPNVTLVDTTSDVWATQIVADVDMTVQTTVYANSDSAANSTRLLASRMRVALDLPDGVDAAANARVSMRSVSTIVDISDTEPGGAVLQAQSTFDVLVGGSSIVSRVIEPIDSAVVTVNLSGNEISIPIPAP